MLPVDICCSTTRLLLVLPFLSFPCNSSLHPNFCVQTKLSFNCTFCLESFHPFFSTREINLTDFSRQSYHSSFVHICELFLCLHFQNHLFNALIYHIVALFIMCVFPFLPWKSYVHKGQKSHIYLCFIQRLKVLHTKHMYLKLNIWYSQKSISSTHLHKNIHYLKQKAETEFVQPQFCLVSLRLFAFMKLVTSFFSLQLQKQLLNICIYQPKDVCCYVIELITISEGICCS